MTNHRILQSVVLFIVVAFIVIAGWFFAQKKWLFFQPIKQFELVHSLEHIPPTEVHAVVEPYLNQSFWGIDLDQIQAALNSLDWVRYTEVSRQWPDKLSIEITEQSPVARWGESGLINGHGHVFFPASLVGYETLVRLNGPLNMSTRVLAQFVQLQALLEPIDMVVQQLDYRNDVWQVDVLNGPNLIIDSEGFVDKTIRFVRAYPKIDRSLRNSAEIYDLRYSNGFIVGQSE